MAPVEATKRICKKMGVDLQSFDLYEYNDAFSAAAAAFRRAIGDKVVDVVLPGGGKRNLLVFSGLAGLAPSQMAQTASLGKTDSGGKYEVDKDSGAMFVDRFMNTAMHYPCNYGYVPHTLSRDGDPVDVMVVTTYPLIPGSVIECRPIGVLKMTDESGDDAKVLAVPADQKSGTILLGRYQGKGERAQIVRPAIVIRELLKKDLMRGDAMTVTGQSLAEMAADVQETPGQDVFRLPPGPAILAMPGNHPHGFPHQFFILYLPGIFRSEIFTNSP